jgi:spore maturation protein CgeB
MIKLLKASSYYPVYLNWFYARHSHLVAASYAEQHTALMADGFSLSDSWSRHLGRVEGNFEVCELVVNAAPLQKRWARENGFSFSEENWLAEIFLEQCRRFGPRVLYAHAPEVDAALRVRCKQASVQPLFVITYDGIARNHRRMIEGADLIITCLQSSARYYRSEGANAHWMMFGFDPVLADRLDRSLPPCDVSFVGGLAVRIGHQARAKDLDRISRSVPLQAWISGLPNDDELLRQWLSFARHAEWKGFAGFPAAALAARKLRKLNQGEVFGVEMLSTLAASLMTLNIHIAAAGEQAANIRLFESTGVGTCLVTDWKKNIGELFEPDREVVVFRSAAEAVEKIKHLLNHREECRAIAERGRARTLRSHNYADRLAEFEAVLLPLL